MLPLPALIIVVLGLLGNGTIPDVEDSIRLAQPVATDGAVPQGQCYTAECKLAAEQKEDQERAAQEKAARAKLAQEKALQQKIAQDKAAQEKAAQEKAAHEKAAQQKAAQEKAAQQKAAQEKAAQEKAAHEKAAQEKAAQEKAAQEQAAQKNTAKAKESVPTAAKDKPAEQDAGPGIPEPYEGGTEWTGEQLKSLDKHNELRNRHGAPSLGLSRGLCAMATKYAKYLASIDKMVHTTLEQRKNTGESLYVEFGRKVNSGEGERAAQYWYDEIKDYDYSSPGFGLKTGHFTQVVWHKTTEVGVGVAISATGKTYVVANYWIAGNMENEFATNVGKKI